MGVDTWWDGPAAKNSGERVCDANETLSRVTAIQHLVGITRISDITGLDVIGLPVAAAYRPASRSLAASHGKGQTLAAAKVSALMESIEAYHAEQPIASGLRLSSYATLVRAELVVEIDRLPGVSGRCFDRKREIVWIAGWELSVAAHVWVPYECVHTNYVLPGLPASGALQVGTNGLASGNTLAEAIRHGIEEIVERDAVALWYAGTAERRQSTLVAVDTIDGEAGALIAHLRSCGLAVYVWDLTSDVGVPVFLAMLEPGAQSGPDDLLVVDGFGCSTSRSAALTGALREAVQVRATIISGARDDIGRSYYDAAVARRTAARRRSRLLSRQGRRDFLEIPDRQHRSVNDDVAELISRLNVVESGQIIVVDLTDGRLGIPVVRVVVPGMEGVPFDQYYFAGARSKAVAGTAP